MGSSFFTSSHMLIKCADQWGKRFSGRDLELARSLKVIHLNVSLFWSSQRRPLSHQKYRLRLLFKVFKQFSSACRKSLHSGLCSAHSETHCVAANSALFLLVPVRTLSATAEGWLLHLLSIWAHSLFLGRKKAISPSSRTSKLIPLFLRNISQSWEQVGKT